MKKPILTAALCATAICRSDAAIISVVETGLGGDAAAIIAPGFGEDALTFSDRDHQHNGAAFSGGILSTTGVDIIDLPAYLVGNDYIRFANDARENADYSAEVTTDLPSRFFLLLDNRINGPAGNTSSPNSTDPELGGTFQWVIDGGWQRVNTGISPDGQADYTGVDEGGDGVGAGQGLNQFYSVYEFPTSGTSVTVGNNGTGGSNMISLVVVPAPDPEAPIGSFAAQAKTISEGESADLLWFIHEMATVATIDNGIGDILPETTDGAGSTDVSPAVTTTYTLSVESPDGDATAEATVEVRLVNSFESDQLLVDAGDAVTLSWDTRSDAQVTILGVGAVTPDAGSVAVNPTETTTYTLTAEAGEESGEAEVTVYVNPPGQLFALLDIGATDGTVEAGALGDMQIGAGINNTNGTDLPATDLTSDTGVNFSIAIDNIAPDGAPVGNIDWRDRGDSSGELLTYLGEDLVKNNAGILRVILAGLPAGEYDVLSWHYDPLVSQSEAITILVTDDNGVAVDTGVIGSAFETVPTADNTTADMLGHQSQFKVLSNGADDVILYFDARAAIDTEVPLNGLRISESGPAVPLQIVRIELVDDGDMNGDTMDVEVEFNSKEGRTYSIFAGSDLSDFSEELDDAFPGEVGTTIFVDPSVDTSVNLRKYYRITQN